MEKPPIPENEEARLAELMDYLILDTAGEEVFDLITKLAASICEVPTSLVTLIARNRQWFKSIHNLNIESKEVPRDVAFCSYTILNADILEISDALEDSRFKRNPLVLNDPKIRFYAGAPLTTPNGLNLGALCVIGPQPKVLSQQQKDQLTNLSQVTMKLLDVRRGITKKEEENWRIQEAAKVKEMVLANMSHELLTPLNAIVGFAQLLDDDQDNITEGERRDYVAHILERSNFLLRIITNILNLTNLKLEGMEFKYELTFLDKEIEEVIASLRKTLDFKKIKLSIELNPENLQVSIDRYWFKQIVNCYLSNAIEIAPSEGSVTVQVKLKSKDSLYIEIKDSATIIDMHDLETLFLQESYTYSEVLKKYPGIGFNLMLIKQIVEAQGGKMGVKLAKKGCVFNAIMHCEP